MMTDRTPADLADRIRHCITDQAETGLGAAGATVVDTELLVAVEELLRRQGEQLDAQTALATHYAGKAVEYKQEWERQGEQLDTLRADKFQMQKLLDRALQEAWDDYVGDTHCHPPDFTVEGGRSNYTLSASFRSNWTLYAAERLSLWLAAAVPQDPEEGRA